MDVFDDHSNSCPATDRMQLTGRTQVGQRTQMARSWVGRIPCSRHIQQSSAQSGPSEQAHICVGGVQISLPYEGKKNMTLRE